IRHPARPVDLWVVALSARPRALRLSAWLFGSLAFFATVALAAYAALWVARDLRSPGRSGEVAGALTAADLHLPPGLVAVQRVPDAGAFERLAGFPPFVPEAVPSTTKPQASLAVTLPDEQGRRVGRVGFSMTEEAVDGITGPTIVLVEAPGAPGAGVDGELKRITDGSGRALAATLPCGGLVIDVQLYFQPDPQPGEPFVTPYMTAVAQDFIDRVKQECG